MNSQILKRANFAAIGAAIAAILLATSAVATSFQVLHSFSGPDGETPGATLVQGAGGSLGGVAAHGGDFTVLSPDGGGETVTVTTLDDVSDFSGLQQVSDLPGPDRRVSFREAVTAANNTSGAQTIAFAIPPAEFWLVPDVGLLRLEQGAFFLNDSGTTVDFSTQTANMGDTNPNGPEIGIYGLEANGWGIAAIFINGDNCVVKGLGKVYQRGYAVRIVGNNNRVIGCQIDGPLHAAVSVSGYMGWPPPSGNIVGGTAPGEGNRLIGLAIDGPAEGNIVIGNTIVGVEVRGATQYGVFARNNRIGGPTPAERNVIAGAGSYGEEGFPDGAQVSIVDADGTLVEGNYIGTTADGMHPTRSKSARWASRSATLGTRRSVPISSQDCESSASIISLADLRPGPLHRRDQPRQPGDRRRREQDRSRGRWGHPNRDALGHYRFTAVLGASRVRHAH